MLIIKLQERQLRPADGGGISLVLTEAVDALDGGRLDVVSQEEAVIPPRSPTGLLHHHHHQSLDRMAVSRHAVPVVSLQLRKHPRTAAAGLEATVPSSSVKSPHKPPPFPGWCTGFQSSGRKRRRGWQGPGSEAAR